MSRPIKAPTGVQLTCKNWLIEAAYRMEETDRVVFFPSPSRIQNGRCPIQSSAGRQSRCRCRCGAE